MKTGEIVETLIYLRDHSNLTAQEDFAVCAACNILDRFPPMTEYEDAKDAIREVQA